MPNPWPTAPVEPSPSTPPRPTTPSTAPPTHAALYEALEEALGRPLAGVRVADIGAGTGIATAQLTARGAHVLAVEPGEGMAAELRRTLPGTPWSAATATPSPRGRRRRPRHLRPVLPLDRPRACSPRGVPRAAPRRRPGPLVEHLRLLPRLGRGPGRPPARPLRPRGRRPRRARPGPRRRGHRPRRRGPRRGSAGQGPLPPRRPRTRTGGRRPAHPPDPLVALTTVDDHLANLASHSLFLVADAALAQDFLDRERAELLRLFPDGHVEERYVLDLVLTTRPASA